MYILSFVCMHFFILCLHAFFKFYMHVLFILCMHSFSKFCKHVFSVLCMDVFSILCMNAFFTCLTFSIHLMHASICCTSVLADVTSCSLRKGGCDHICSLGAEGRIHCSCRAGWELSTDQRTCIGKTYKTTVD